MKIIVLSPQSVGQSITIQIQDTTEQETHERYFKVESKCEEKCEDDNTNFFLIDNKSDLENSEVLNFEAEDYANKNNLEEIQDSKPIQITEEENSGKP